MPSPGGGKAAASAPGPAPSSLRGSCQRLYQPPIRAREVLEAEDAGADDEQVRPGLVRGADVLRLDASVDLDEAVDKLARACEPVVGVLHELLAPVARFDRHAEAEIGALVGGLRSHLDRRLGTEGDPDSEPVL